MTIFILKLLALWTVASIALGLIIGPILKRLRHSQSVDLPPLPSGSIDRDRISA
jgi:hypothetical protein